MEYLENSKLVYKDLNFFYQYFLNHEPQAYRNEVNGGFPSKLPLTKTMLDTVNNLIPEDKIEVKSPGFELKPKDVDTSRILREAFYNEMLLMSQLDEFLEKEGLGMFAESHRDVLLDRVGNKGFIFDVVDKAEEISQELVEDTHMGIDWSYEL